MRNLKCTAPGWIAVVICRNCGYMAALPDDRLLKRFGARIPADAPIWVWMLGMRGAVAEGSRFGALALVRWPLQ